MNMRFGEIPNYISHFKNIENNNLIICPSYIYIPYFLNYGFHVGSQNVCIEEDGGYTGEISAKQLYSIGVKYTIVGHSERRNKLKETDIEINQKIKSSLKSHLKVILCVGETEEEKELLKKDVVLKRQIRNALFGIEDLNNIIIAYEPVWSVGTNKLPSNEELLKTVLYNIVPPTNKINIIKDIARILFFVVPLLPELTLPLIYLPLYLQNFTILYYLFYHRINIFIFF